MRALLILATLLATQAPAQTLTRFGAEGGDFRAELSDGRILRGADLVGATLHAGQAGQVIPIRIEAAHPDPTAPDIWLFHLTTPGPDNSRQEFCSPDPEGQRLAIPYPAADQPMGFAISCTSGAVGKCMRAGYRPWAMAPDGRTSLAPFHAACVNMIRAAYGGPARALTAEGIRIDLYDRIGIQAPENDPTQAFEAGWTPAGAVCLAHPRVPANGSLAEIAAAAPQLAGHTGPAACTEERAAALGALLFNRSGPPGAAPR